MNKIREYVDIKGHSSLQVGGKFRYFVELENKNDLKEIYSFAKKNKLEIFILGGGSNIVFSDGILNILAIKIKILGFEIIKETDDYIDIKVGSGEIWDNIVKKTVNMNLLGLEALSLIPGTVGATPVQNVGAYGSEVKDTILEVHVYDIKNSISKIISNQDCKFRYRDSVFKNEYKGKYIITEVVYRLKKLKNINNQKKVLSSALKYPGVMVYFSKKNIDNPNLKQIREAIIYIRNQKLPNPKNIPNVGSFFKNPIVSNSIASFILKKFTDAKFFKIDDNFTKIPAGWLIDKAGLKGKSFGNVSVYDKNALILINNGNATKKDISRAKHEIIRIIEDKFKIRLEQEPENI